MKQVSRLALAALVLTIVYGLARLADPQQRWAALMLGGDRVEHACVAYLVTLFSLAAFRRLPLWAPALALTLAGAAIEAAQALPGVVGAPQPGDVLANVAGTLAATLPPWLIRRARS